jgi:ATP-dependent DNA ligase
VAAVTVLPVTSCLIDGEAVVCDETGLAVFDLIRGYRHDAAAVLCAFDLLEVDGKDLRREPIEERKRILAKLLSHPHEGIAPDGCFIVRDANGQALAYVTALGGAPARPRRGPADSDLAQRVTSPSANNAEAPFRS